MAFLRAVTSRPKGVPRDQGHSALLGSVDGFSLGAATKGRSESALIFVSRYWASARGVTSCLHYFESETSTMRVRPMVTARTTLLFRHQS